MDEVLSDFKLDISLQFLKGKLVLKIKGKTLSGFIFDDEFESVAEFIQLQLEDFPAMDDSVEILNVEIDEEIYHFRGNAGELYYELTKK